MHKFQGSRGLYARERKSEIEHYMFVRHEQMLEYTEKFRNTFTIQIVPQEFSEEDFEKFTFPKPVMDYLANPESLSTVSSKTNASQCKNKECRQKFDSVEELKEHFIQKHRLEYVCPYEKCRNQVRIQTLFEFARHIYYHENKHPQFEYPHECLACGFETPFIKQVETHVKNEGPFHDNQCPNCPERFFSRSEFVEHTQLNQHNGFRCGLCSEVFDTNIKKRNHRKNCLPGVKLEEFVCTDCGKVFYSKDKLYAHNYNVHRFSGTWPCEFCDKVAQTQNKLKAHISKVHNRRPCPYCGKIVSQMDVHIKTVHTDDNLKPYSCEICQKGFNTQHYLNTHMNTHTGNKPHKCKFQIIYFNF